MTLSPRLRAFKARLQTQYVTCPLCNQRRAYTIQHIINKARVPTVLQDEYPIEWCCPMCWVCNSNRGEIGADTPRGRKACIVVNVRVYGYERMKAALDTFSKNIPLEDIYRLLEEVQREQ